MRKAYCVIAGYAVRVVCEGRARGKGKRPTAARSVPSGTACSRGRLSGLSSEGVGGPPVLGGGAGRGPGEGEADDAVVVGAGRGAIAEQAAGQALDGVGLQLGGLDRVVQQGQLP